MITVAIVSFFASAALAQSSASKTSTASSIIPTGISTGCSTFLNSLNTDSSLQACTSSIISSTANYGPGGNLTGSPSASGVSSTLNSLCSASTNSSCSDSLIRTTLSNFYTGCSAELTSSPNSEVKTLYDVLYTMIPMKEALCSKDDSGSYCAVKTSSYVTNSSSTGVGSNAAVAAGSIDINKVAQTYSTSSISGLSRRAQAAAMLPNTTTWQDANIPFLFLTADTASSAMCTSCTRNIISAFVTFESTIPYGPGLGQSTLLSGQSALYQAVSNQCGSNFLAGTVNAAGSLSDGSSSSNDAPKAALGVSGSIAMIIGVATVAFMSIQ